MKNKNNVIYPEYSLIPIIIGVIQGIILNIAFVYIALKLGFAIGGSAIAAITGMVLLRLFHPHSTLLENNLNQTIASSINSVGTGITFILPALFLLSTPSYQSLLPLLIAAICGALLGIVFIIPLRKQLIEIDRLRFPTGTAVASVLRSGKAGSTQAQRLFWGLALALIWNLFLFSDWAEIPGLLEQQELNISFGILPDYMTPALYLSLMNFGAGLLAGRAGLPFLAGGFIAWWFISPSIVYLNWLPTQIDTAEIVNYIYDQLLRPLSIGVLIGAACIEVIRNLPMLKLALQALYQAKQSHKQHQKTYELPLNWVIGIALVAAFLLFLNAYLLLDLSFWQAFSATSLGLLWILLAGLVVAQSTGLTDISPLSSMTLVAASFLLLLFDQQILIILMITLSISVAIGQSADMMQDLKTGYLIGSRPLVQQIAQLSFTWLGAIVSFAVIYLFWQSGSFGAGTALPAPQASAIAELISASQNNSLDHDKLLFGGLIGAILALAPIMGLGILIGLAMYLPFSVTLGYGLGCLAHIGLKRRFGERYIANKVIPFAAGLIIGEALVGVANAIYQIT